jgi:hypothetical protein
VRSAVTEEPAQSANQAVRVGAFLKKLLHEFFDGFSLERFEPALLIHSAHRFEERADLNVTSSDRRFRELAFFAEMPHVRIKKPPIGLDNPFWFRRREDFDLNQVIKEVLESAKSGLPGRIIYADRLRMSEIEFEKRIDVRLGKLCTARNTLLQQKSVELAAFTQNEAPSGLSIASGLEVSGKAVKMWPEEAASEIDQSAFVFVPMFERKIRCVLV